MMKKYYCSSSSIARSFAYVFLFSTLFALSFFSFPYLHPKKFVNINGIYKLFSSTALTGTSMEEDSATINGGLDELVDSANSTTDHQALNNKTVDTNVLNKLVNSTTSSIEFDSNRVNNTLLNSTTPTTEVDINGVNNPINDTTTSSAEVVDDDPLLPPKEFSKEERIAWFKQKVPRLRILDSTPLTRRFDQRVQEFLAGQGTNRTSCMARVFMIWIAPVSQFGKRQLLSLESVFKSHPKGCVVMLSPSLDSRLGAKVLEPLLSRGYQVFPVSPDLPFLSNNTPAQSWLEGLKNGTIDPGKIPFTQNLSNLLRLLVIYKYGGIYLDIDFIIVKDVSGLSNSIGIQSVDDTTKEWKTLNNAMLIFDKEHPLMLKFIEEFAAHFDGNVWGQNGPYMVTRVVGEFINDSRFQFNLLSPMAFYPVNWIHIWELFEQPKNSTRKKWVDEKLVLFEKQCYGVHLWNRISSQLKIEKRSIIGRLISDHCVICQDVYHNEGPKASNLTAV